MQQPGSTGGWPIPSLVEETAKLADEVRTVANHREEEVHRPHILIRLQLASSSAEQARENFEKAWQLVKEKAGIMAV